MNGSDFERIMKLVFSPFLERLGFVMQPIHVSGRYYRAVFVGSRYTLLVAFEPGDEQTMVILLQNGEDDLQSIDNPARSLRLSDLNARYMGVVAETERAANENFFKSHKPRDDAERKLIKCAKDLRLVLPHHLAVLSKPSAH